MLRLNIDADPHTGTRGLRIAEDADEVVVDWEGIQVHVRRLAELAIQCETKVLVPREQLTRFYVNARFDADLPDDAEATYTATMSPHSSTHPYGVTFHTFDPDHPHDFGDGALRTHNAAFSGERSWGLNLYTPSLQPAGSNWSASVSVGTRPVRIEIPQHATDFGVVLAPMLTPFATLSTLGQLQLTP